jgi:chorismate lyase / 3-hydroxybenzoate synthase
MSVTMMHSPGIAWPPALEVSADPGAGVPLLGFSLGARAMQRAAVGTGLVWLGGDFEREQWLLPAAVETATTVDGWSALSGGLMSIAMARPDRREDDPEPLAYAMYRDLIERVRSAGFPEFLRIWNYFSGINHGSGDQERYRRFCLGRGRALAEAGLDDSAMCAATAIGSDEERFRLFALAGRRRGLAIENPRQVPAWAYPRRYGPRSPAFARATALPLAGNRVGLLISGTASVVGHVTAHPGDVLAQADEAAANVETLIAVAADRLELPGPRLPGATSLLRVYVRQPADWPPVEKRLRARWPGVRLAGLRGDICRRDLLVEIEAWHGLEAAMD